MRSHTLLRLNRLIPGRLKFAAVLAADLVGARHLIVRMDPIIACNIRCGMCYFSDEQFLPPGPARRFSQADIERLAEMFLPLAVQFHIGCGTEPTMFKGYPKLVEMARQYKVPFVGFTTNGQLLTEAGLRTMIAAGLSEITLSTHGITEETYERLMAGASFERYHRNVRMLADLKKQMGVNNPMLRINYTVNASNLEELPQFFEKFDEYGISTLQLRPMDKIGNTAYRWDDMSAHAARYNEIVHLLAEQCRVRGIHLLANTIDPGYQAPNTHASVYEKGVLRVLDPNNAWQPDFDFRTTTYREYLKAKRYRRELLGYVLRGDRSIVRASRHASSQVLN